MPDSFTFQLVPDDERIPLDTLQQAVEHIAAIVKSVDQSVSRDWRRPRTWFVERIHTSYPTFYVSPGPRLSLVPAEVFPDTAHVLVEGLAALSDDATDSPPPYFSEIELQRLQKMRSLFRRGKGLARIDSWAAPSAHEEGPVPPVEQVASVSSDVSERAQRILGSGYKEFGSVEGELGALRVRNRPMFTIWDAIYSRPVHCYFDRDEIDQVKDLLDRRVRASGLVRYYMDGRPASITDLQALDDLSPQPLRPRASFGSIPDLTGGRETSEYLRLLRENG